MDLLQDYLTACLPLPLRLLLTTRSSPASTSTSTYNTYLTHLAPLLRRYLTPYIPTPLLHLLSPLLRLLANTTSHLPALVSKSPTDLDFTTLAVLVVLLVISLKAMNMLRRMVFYWVGMAVRLGVWAVVGVGVLWVWKRGLEGSLEDLVGVVAGLGGGDGMRDLRRGQGQGQGGGGGGRGSGWEREMGRARGRWR